MTRAAVLALLAGVLVAAVVVDLAAIAGTRQAAAGTRSPTGRRAVALLARLARQAGVAVRPVPSLADRLAAAGFDERALAEVASAKAGAALVAGVLAVPLGLAAPGRLWLLVVPGLPALAWLLPDLWMARRRRRRAAALDEEAAEVLDLVRVATAAGVGPTRAFGDVGGRHRGLLALELGLVARQVAVGVPKHEALTRLGRRCPVPVVAGLVAAVHRADRHGTPLADALRSLAADARAERARLIKDRAAKAGPKIQLVVALLLVPAVMLMVAAAMVGTVL